MIQFEKKIVFVLGQNWESMSSLIEAREKGVKKAKKMDFAKTKTDIYKQQNLLSKICCVTIFTCLIQLKKKIDFDQKWKSMSSFAKQAQI